jgi:hypothetical protein
MRRFFGVLLLLAVPIGVRAQTNFTVVNNGLIAYRIDGVDNPALNLIRGNTYVFNVNATGHPFYIKTAFTIGIGDQWTQGVTGQGVQVGPCTFVVPGNAPATLFYHCSVHSGMGGTLNIKDPVDVPPGTVPQLAWLGPAVPNPANEGASFRFGIPRTARVDFSVFDTRGRAVRALSSGVFRAGEHSVRWDGRDRDGRLAPSGVYYYRLKIDVHVLSGRLVLTH